MLNIPASEIAVGDYVAGFGTVSKVNERRNVKSGDLETLGFEFKSGQSLYGLSPASEFMVNAGGLTDHGPIGSIRPGLAEDHPNA